MNIDHEELAQIIGSAQDAEDAACAVENYLNGPPEPPKLPEGQLQVVRFAATGFREVASILPVAETAADLSPTLDMIDIYTGMLHSLGGGHYRLRRGPRVRYNQFQ